MSEDEIRKAFEESSEAGYCLTREENGEYLYEDVEMAWRHFKRSYLNDYRAFSMLESYGVPRQRAGTIANGIDVLMTRMNKQSHSYTYAMEQVGRYMKEIKYLIDTNVEFKDYFSEKTQDEIELMRIFD